LTKKQWRKPTIKTLRAGDAENGTRSGLKDGPPGARLS
jgi:hypothetical protein